MKERDEEIVDEHRREIYLYPIGSIGFLVLCYAGILYLADRNYYILVSDLASQIARTDSSGQHTQANCHLLTTSCVTREIHQALKLYSGRVVANKLKLQHPLW